MPVPSLQTVNERHLRIGYKYYNIYHYSRHFRIGEIKMKQEKNEVFDIRNYLVENDYPNGLITMLDDYFTNKTISREEIEEMMEQENFAELVGNYQLRGAKK